MTPIVNTIIYHTISWILSFFYILLVLGLIVLVINEIIVNWKNRKNDHV